MNKDHKKAKTGIGIRIREWRKSQHMKSFELAKLIKISQGSLSDIENNKSDPSASTIVNVLTLTDVDWRWLLTGERGEVLAGDKPEKKPALVINVEPGMEFIIIGRDKLYG